MANKDKAAFLIGLARKAGKVKSGEWACLESIRDGTACLVILAEDTSVNTAKKISDKCSYYRIPLIRKYLKTELGKMIGEEERAAAAVTDKGLADAVMEKMSDSEEKTNNRCEGQAYE